VFSRPIIGGGGALTHFYQRRRHDFVVGGVGIGGDRAVKQP